ncbi:hypothetical protein TRFO_39819 [Tritrichomonas foetus]|uniref:Uncharacterized protein n=1 Tax=Tritrichomonas foetus TaxID=1144522 RepID=A0A1J4J3M0_9EUKA|nr:hypothetical protein TRFO_39819 [Tritrichomonas foetus]|eukprot:OHS94022.1 hypothetical protein TRFO_39819 [Tritrichomonas foetus]
MFNLDDLDQYEDLLGSHRNDERKPKILNIVREELKAYIKDHDPSYWKDRIVEVKQLKMSDVVKHWFSYHLKTLTNEDWKI